MRGTLLGCARAVSGHVAAAPPSSVMKSRLLVCRERSIVRGDEDRIMIRPSARAGSPGGTSSARVLAADIISLNANAVCSAAFQLYRLQVDHDYVLPAC